LVARRFILLKDSALDYVPELNTSQDSNEQRHQMAVDFLKLYLKDLFLNKGADVKESIFKVREIQAILLDVLLCAAREFPITSFLPIWFLKNSVLHAWLALLWSRPAVTEDYLSQFDVCNRYDFVKFSEVELGTLTRYISIWSLKKQDHEENEKSSDSYVQDFAKVYLPEFQTNFL
jgi:hypothetical protein